MELVTDNVHLIKRFVSDFDAFWVDVGVKFTSDGQSSTGGSGSHEIHNHLMADKRLPSPILTDVSKESMFNLVPLAGSWWQMANGDLQTSFIGPDFSDASLRASQIRHSRAGFVKMIEIT